MRLSQKEFDFIANGKYKKKPAKKLELVSGETKTIRSKNIQLEKRNQKDFAEYIQYQPGFDCIRHDVKGVWIGHKYIPNHYPGAGFPDLEVFYKGRVFFIEVKLRGEKQKPKQIEFEERCKRNKIPYKICYDLNDVIVVINWIRSSF